MTSTHSLRGEFHDVGDCTVHLDGHALHPAESQRVFNHSPDGFAWGYEGSGPAQLALAICLRLYPSVEEAQVHYQEFKRQVIARLPQRDSFSIVFAEHRRWEIVR